MNTQIELFTYEIGNPGFRGKTQIKVNKKGRVDLSHQQGDNTEKFSGQLVIDEFQSFKQLLEQTDPCSIKSHKKRIEPDDVPLKIVLMYEHNSCEFNGWESEKFQNSQLNQLVSELNNIASKISAGKVNY